MQKVLPVASTLRDKNSGWAGPLVSRGAAATVGNVYEAYLELTAHLDILNDRLLHGFTFAESVFMSSRGLSWMGVAVGDPLYRPISIGPRSTRKLRRNPPRDGAPIMISRSKTATWSLPIIALRPGLLPVGPATPPCWRTLD
jgi:hypothetical protein